MQQVLAASGGAFAAVQRHGDSVPSSWTIGNDVISKTVAWYDDGGLSLVELANCTTGHTWHPSLFLDPLAGGEFSLVWNDATLSARQATVLHAVLAQADAAAVTLQFDLRLADALDITFFYSVHAAT